jgi:methionyl-tRNA formyltransferase
MLDVAAFRLYYRAVLAARDRAWERGALATLVSRHPPLPATLPIHVTASPNRRAVQDFLETLAPDLVLARCKVLLKERIFSVPADGTFILHPGICPEYRNAHGCFWALVRDDLENVGATLLRIDRGIDTGPIYGYFRYPYDEVGESHVVIQHRTVLDNLDAIRERLLAVHRGEARPLDASGRPSGSWGQPWLSRYLGWKRRARRRARAAA